MNSKEAVVRDLELPHVGAYRRRAAGNGDIPVERRLRIRDRSFLRNSNAADGTTRARNAHRRAHRFSVPNALEDGVRAESAG